jgi:hypothetical protein
MACVEKKLGVQGRGVRLSMFGLPQLCHGVIRSPWSVSIGLWYHAAHCFWVQKWQARNCIDAVAAALK